MQSFFLHFYYKIIYNNLMKQKLLFLTAIMLMILQTSCASMTHNERIGAGMVVGAGVGAAANSDRPLAGGVAGAAIGSLVGYFSR